MGYRGRIAARIFLLLLFLLQGQAQPQPVRPPSESVIVSGSRGVSPQAIDRFIESFAAPTVLLGKLSRWETAICPVAVGLRPAALQFLLQRLRDTARSVGAPVNDRAGCRANIEIVFTTTPQGLLDNVRKDHAVYLGYSGNSAQADRLARVTHDIQAWYTTATKDLNGIAKIDSVRSVGLGDANDLAFALGMGNTTGLRTHDGLTGALHHVIIAVDPGKLAEHEIGGVADYISFLALSQMTSLDRCQQLASIINMLVPGCAASADAMTPNDLAFLRGLYKMPLGGNLRLQKDEIGYEMVHALQAGEARN